MMSDLSKNVNNYNRVSFCTTKETAVRAQIERQNALAVAPSNFSVPCMDFDDRIYKDCTNWQIREALVYSYHWSFSMLTAEDFIQMKRDCFITDLLSSNASLFVKQSESKQYLGL